MSASDFDIVRFPAAVDEEGKPDARTAGWYAAVSPGFHEDEFTDADVARKARYTASDGRILTSVFSKDDPEGLDGTSRPVATYGSMQKTINVGGGALIDAHLVTAVTVRPTHRRRGILREMITTDLTDAHARGLAVAVLTASEASIYRRFGFGKAAFARRVAFVTDARFALLQAPAGRVEVVERAWLADHAGAIFDAFHAKTLGSVDRHASYIPSVLGLEGADGTPDRSIRVAVHVAADGGFDGYVTYRAKGDDSGARIDVVDLVAASADAYLGLWDFVGAIDLATKAQYDILPIDDPLVWALVDSRVAKTTAIDDALWARILDLPAAFAARPYLVDGVATLAVTDALGFAHGTWRLAAQDGRGSVSRVADAPSADADLALDVSTLGSLLLGSVAPSVLVAARDAVATDATRLAGLDALFAQAGAPYCITHF